MVNCHGSGVILSKPAFDTTGSFIKRNCVEAYTYWRYRPLFYLQQVLQQHTGYCLFFLFADRQEMGCANQQCHETKQH